MSKLKVAVIGCGYWGPNFIRIISQSKNASLEAICDLDEDKLDELAALYPNANVYTDYQNVADATEIDAVVISTPVKTHFEIAKACLNGGKHVLVEKPITQTSAQAKELGDLAESKKLTLMVGHTFLFNAALDYIKDSVLGKEFGAILHVNFMRAGLGPVREDVNSMWDLATHDISIILNMLEMMPTTVTAFGKSYLQENIEDVVYLTLEFENKVIVQIHSSWLDPAKIRTMTIVGEKQMVVFNDISVSEKVRIHDKGVSYQTESGEFGEFQLALRDGAITIPNIKNNEPLRTEFNHFIDCIREGLTPVSDAIVGYNVVRVLEAAQQSLNNDNKKILL